MRIEAINEAGQVVHRFETLRAAARAGFTLSRLSKAVKTGQTHKGFRWRQVDALHGLPAWLRQRTTSSTGDIDAKLLHEEFLTSLPAAERGIPFNDFVLAARPVLINYDFKRRVFEFVRLLSAGEQ